MSEGLSSLPEKFSPARFFLVAALVFLFSLAVFTRGVFTVSFDLATYLAYADNFLDGRGITGATGEAIDSRILYILMLAGVQALFGDSLMAVSLFEAAWCACLSTLLWLVSRRLFPSPVALCLALIFILTPGLMFWLPRHIDVVWPTFVVASLLMMIHALDLPANSRRRLLLLAASGAVIVLAIKTKEMAWLAVPVPLVLGLIDTRIGGWRGPASFLTGFVATYLIVSLAFSTITETTHVSTDANDHLSWLEQRIGGWNVEGFLNRFVLALKGAARYFTSGGSYGFSGMMPLWPLGILGLFLAFFDILRRRSVDRKDKMGPILVAAAAFAPFAVYSGILSLRPSQNMPFVICLFLGLGYILSALFSALCKLTQRLFSTPALYRRAPIFALIALTPVLAGYHLFSDQVMLQQAIRTGFLSRLISGESVILTRDPGGELASWINENREIVASHGGSIIIDSVLEQHSVSRAAKAPVRIYGTPWIILGDSVGWTYYRKQSELAPRPALLTLFSWKPPATQAAMFYLTRPELTELRSKSGTSLIAITRSNRGVRLEEWLLSQFETRLLGTVGARNRQTRIYQLGKVRDTSKTTLAVDKRMGSYIKWVLERDAAAIKTLKVGSLSDVAHITLGQFQQMQELEPKKGSLLLEFLEP